jgi:hypothetical protein
MTDTSGGEKEGGDEEGGDGGDEEGGWDFIEQQRRERRNASLSGRGERSLRSPLSPSPAVRDVGCPLCGSTVGHEKECPENAAKIGASFSNYKGGP